MATLRSPVQVLNRRTSAFLQLQQRRWAQVHDVRFLATHKPNHVLDRYKDKLARKANEEGHDSIESLKEAYKEKIENARRKALAITPQSSVSDSSFRPQTPSPLASHTTSFPSTPHTVPASAGSLEQSAKSSGIKPLSSYLDVAKISTLPPKEIEVLWRLRHANNPNSICACIPLETYQRIVSAARNNPQFILPLPRQHADQRNGANTMDSKSPDNDISGADIHFLQWAFHPPATTTPTGGAAFNPAPTANTHTSTIIFTHLAAYKLHGSYAEPHTTITHHLDLADEKGLVLMHGQVVPDRGVNTAEASWLVSCVQRFYDLGGQVCGRKAELLQMFTRGDVERFTIEELMEETEKL